MPYDIEALRRLAGALTDAEYRTIRAIRASARRKVHGGGPGRPGRPTPCLRCGGVHQSLRAARLHAQCERCRKPGFQFVWITDACSERHQEWLCDAHCDALAYA